MEPWKLQPARDTGLTPSERFRSVRRESGLLENLTHHACFSLLRSYFAIVHRLSIDGREKLPLHGPFVLAANHCSHLDALALGAALTPRHRERAFPIAAGDVFFQSNVTSTVSAIMLNALPMWRKNCGPHALADLRRKCSALRSRGNFSGFTATSKSSATGVDQGEHRRHTRVRIYSQ